MESLAASLGFDEARLAELCRQYKVKELSIFGSAARGEMRPDSDIDVLVEFQPNSGTGLFDFIGLMQALSDMTGRRVDLASRNGLKPFIRDEIVNSARPVYAAA